MSDIYKTRKTHYILTFYPVILSHNNDKCFVNFGNGSPLFHIEMYLFISAKKCKLVALHTASADKLESLLPCTEPMLQCVDHVT